MSHGTKTIRQGVGVGRGLNKGVDCLNWEQVCLDGKAWGDVGKCGKS